MELLLVHSSTCNFWGFLRFIDYKCVLQNETFSCHNSLRRLVASRTRLPWNNRFHESQAPSNLPLEALLLSSDAHLFSPAAVFCQQRFIRKSLMMSEEADSCFGMYCCCICVWELCHRPLRQIHARVAAKASNTRYWRLPDSSLAFCSQMFVCFYLHLARNDRKYISDYIICSYPVNFQELWIMILELKHPNNWPLFN